MSSAHASTDVAYVYVVPRRQRVKLNVKSCVEIKFRTRLTPSTRCRPRNCIKQVKKRQYSGRRQKRLHDPATWSNATHIMLLRQRALARVFVRGVQRWPVFYAFDEAIRFCVKAYNSSMSYILLWGGRERGAHVHIEGTCQAKKLTSRP